MDVYADGYPLRLLEALQTDYPGLRQSPAARFSRRWGVPSSPLARRLFAICAGMESGFRASSKRARHGRIDVNWPTWPARMGDGGSFDALDAACLSREALTGVSAENWPRLSFIVPSGRPAGRAEDHVTRAWSAQARGEKLPKPQRESTQPLAAEAQAAAGAIPCDDARRGERIDRLHRRQLRALVRRAGRDGGEELAAGGPSNG